MTQSNQCPPNNSFALYDFSRLPFCSTNRAVSCISSASNFWGNIPTISSFFRSVVKSSWFLADMPNLDIFCQKYHLFTWGYPYFGKENIGRVSIFLVSPNNIETSHLRQCYHCSCILVKHSIFVRISWIC